MSKIKGKKMGKRYRNNLGKSEVCPFKPGECAKVRHNRRKLTALQYAEEVMGWACANGVTVSIKNNNHHWKFRKKGKQADWWPSSAKLVFDQLFDYGIHCHDVFQLTGAISNAWNLPVKF